MRLTEARRFLLSMHPNGFSVTMPSQLIPRRSPCNAARIMGQLFSAQFMIADLTVGERAVRKKVLTQKPYRDIDYVLALGDVALHPSIAGLRLHC